MRTVLSEQAVATMGRCGCGEVIHVRLVLGGWRVARGVSSRGGGALVDIVVVQLEGSEAVEDVDGARWLLLQTKAVLEAIGAYWQ